MRYTSFTLFLILVCILAFPQIRPIIPQPVEIKNREGKFSLNASTVIVVRNAVDNNTADFFNEYLRSSYGFQLRKAKTAGKNQIQFTTIHPASSGHDGAYTLTSDPTGILVQGQTAAGTFYGMQTLIQLLPAEKQKLPFLIEGIEVNDLPRFGYRGMHLDVSRHMFPVSFIKKYIDYLALHKLNRFHWHLTDDQGWRIEIKKYPRLTSVGGWRNGTIMGRYPGTGSDNKKYGGFYTQQEIKDVVKYAADRFIEVIPEIEMPGHGSAAIAAYPWLSCFPSQPTFIPANMISKTSVAQQASGRVKLVQETWGVFDDVFCAGKDSTFLFLQDMVDEVIALFPSKYFHIGGDECPKTHWKKCPHCQQRMKEHNLKDEHELQSYFVQRMEKYLNGKQKTLIGWDEILEGGLAPNAVVMSWRGEQGGIDAAKEKHDVIMTPGNPVYFDHTQSMNEDSVTIGGYNPLENVYAYEPIPAELNFGQAKHVLGAQANLWTEYIKNTRKVEYMIFPRMTALSEVLWSHKSSRNWNVFEKKLATQFKRYELWKTNNSKAYYDLRTSVIPSPDADGVLWKLETRDSNYKIAYYRDSYKNRMDVYSAPIKINSPSESHYAVLMNEHSQRLSTIKQPFIISKSTGKKITLKTEPSKNYPGDGAFTLINGVINQKGLGRSREFLGWTGEDLEAVIDLGKAESISNAIVHSLSSGGSWIYPPSAAEIFVSSDGESYQSVGKSTEFLKTTGSNGVMKISFSSLNTRYIKVVVKNMGVIPDGRPGAGNKAWLFVDEIEVN